MPERTEYKHGIPSWVDLGTTDVDAAKAFYAGVFGWTADDQPTDQGIPYTMFSKNGKAVAGGGPLPPNMAEQGAPPMWNSYVNVDSVDDAVAKVEAAGGSVMMPAMDVMSAGRMAFVADPAGAPIGLWQAGDHKGAELVNENGAFTWNELVTDNTEVAKQFFAEVLGWSTEETQMPTGIYTTFKVGDDMAAGMMEKTPDMGPMPNAWSVYFAVDDCDGCTEKIGELGGSVIVPPFDIEGIGRMAVARDPQGAVFSVMAMDQPGE